MFIGHCSLIDAPGRFGAAPMCIEIEAIRTLPTIAGGDVFDRALRAATQAARSTAGSRRGR